MTVRVEARAQEFQREGVLVLPGLLADDPLFLEYVADIRTLLLALYAEAGRAPARDASLAALVTELARTHRPLVGRIYDIGTGPAKLLSAMRLKLHPTFVGLARAVFGTSAVLASPALSDTLHVFPPGAENFRFNLPIHQDYPYLMQSPAQLTLWVSRSEHNVSADRSRLVQLFRYANLDQPAAVATGWASVPPRDGLKLFARTHPDKLAEPLTTPKS